LLWRTSEFKVQKYTIKLFTERMHEPLTVSEDTTIREIKARKEKKRIRPMLPRVAVVGFGICILVVIAANQIVGLDLKTSIICVLIPTPVMLAFLWASPLFTRYADSKWTMKEKKIQMSDGFYIPEKRFNLWDYSVEEFQDCEGYKVVTLKTKNGLSKAIVLKDPTLIERLIDYLETKGVNQSEHSTPRGCRLST
jgi:hypothetical protein